MEISQRKLLFLGLLTLFGFGGIGLSILYFAQDVTPVQFFLAGKAPWWRQILHGMWYGVASAMFALWLIHFDFFSSEMQFFSSLLSKLAPTHLHAVYYSFCAGVGEEILFRGGIQPYLGIWLTSVVFILLHGYLNPFNLALTLYGILMVFISAGLGYLFEIFGVIASMVAHFIFDLLIFVAVRRAFNTNGQN